MLPPAIAGSNLSLMLDRFEGSLVIA